MEWALQAAALPCGMTLARRYDTAEVRASDRCTIVYAGYDRQTLRDVALLEFLPPELAVRADGAYAVVPRTADCGEAFLSGVRAFCEEYRALTAITGCTNVLSVYDAFYENGTAYAVTEPVFGTRLSDYLLWTERLMTVGELTHMLSGLADGLLVLHSLSRAHGDISTDTIFLTESGTAMLAGFSAARRTAFSDLPEASAQNDLRALGAALYEAYTGVRVPDPVSEASLSPLPEQLRGVFFRLLTDDPQAHFTNVFALLHAVNGLSLLREPPHAPPELRLSYERRMLADARRRETARKRARRAKLIRIFGIAAVLIVLAVIAVIQCINR